MSFLIPLILLSVYVCFSPSLVFKMVDFAILYSEFFFLFNLSLICNLLFLLKVGDPKIIQKNNKYKQNLMKKWYAHIYKILNSFYIIREKALNMHLQMWYIELNVRNRYQIF